MDEDKEESEINLTPMLDVVFIMLIFFIVTAVFVREPGVDIERPAAVTAVDPGGGSIFIAVTANNEIWIDRREIDIPGAKSQIERLSSENPEAGIIIQADGQARNEVLIAVMDAAKEAGIADITIAAGD